MKKMQEQNINNIPGQMQQGQPQQMPQMPMQPPMPPRGGQRRQSMRSAVRGIGRLTPLQQERILPNWVVGKSIVFFFIAFIACTIVWGYPMEFELALLSSLSVVLFFYGSKTASQEWAMKKERVFLRNVFLLGLAVRLLWVLFCYMFYNQYVYGKLDGYGDDNGWYMDFAQGISQWLKSENKIPFAKLMRNYHALADDTGYPVWLGILSVISFNKSDVLVPLVFKAVLSTYSCICIYRVAKRHFGEASARLVGLFMCLNPYTIFWCSCMLKETEMMFLCCLYIDKSDSVLSSGSKLTFRGLLPGMLAAFALFFFRSPLGVVAFLAIFTHIVFASRSILNIGKKVLIGIMVGVVLMMGVGDRLQTQSNVLIEKVQSGAQKTNMEWRSTRKDGANVFAQYIGASVFAPLIFTIPFPTFNKASESQILQAQLSGANYIKNIFSFFFIYAIIMMFTYGEWRKHVFLIAYTLGYHIVLVMSSFAQSGRFHMPVFPMLLLFAVCGIQMAKTNPRIKDWFPIVLVVEVFACLAWNWFKLAGRGMI